MSASTVDASWFALALAASAAIVGAAWRLKALTVSGSVAAFFVGVACLGAGGLRVGAPLLAFFVSGSLLSRARGGHATPFEVQQKGATRDAMQVLANGGAAAACAIVARSLVVHGPILALPWIAASINALAVAAADTWATEIGARSSTLPRSIATGRVVQAGASGGVTLLGFLASTVGGAAIGAVAAAFMPEHRIAAWALLCAAVGFAGAALDSILGATLQAVWHCDGCGAACETKVHGCGARARLVRGLAWIDNDGVNAFATIAGAVLGYAALPLVG